MTTALLRSAFSLALVPALLGAQPATTPLFWPAKNGPTRDGIVPAAEAARVLLEWDGASGKNIAWRIDLEGEGHSTPVIGGDLIWFTAATADGKQQFVYGIDRHSGKVLHHKVVFENAAPEDLGNPLNNYAAPSPVLEADALYVHFGTYGTARIDPVTCEKVWERRDINVRHYRGPGSSPIIHGDLLILTFDGIDQQFVTALDKKTGKTVWKTARTTDYGDLDKDGHPTRDGDMRKAYHTPGVFEIGGKEVLVSVGSRAAFGYDIKTGRELWTIRHGGFNAAIPPLRVGDLLILNTGSERAHTLGVRIDDKMTGDITESHVLWDREKRNASESAPVLVGGVLYQTTRGGIVSAVEAKTGKDLWEDRMEGQHLPGPVVVGDKLLFSNDRGQTFIVRVSPEKFELVGKNQVAEPITASAVVADGALFLRAKGALYKIAAK
ncbi:MAG: PQQ-binding-like beta-propeller repeat protein [Prosthecobacter sp.]|jgi:outer membrane protein assembly factor BamB|uniref:outer membrane protein assembly factor BamB family protein n=1 Tax=Prosthecobacter sp. TaxID=1965333 RepID=UPI001A0EEBE1|nr:PQQ-binding-like beta-propeller repeat protein [Prosthecobacter sp.]MBE2283761.1 PQQ-binding-like beta-propeller repeat protein [Prosthecobacter sp.]